jgi:hypothetical protein
VTIVNKKVRFMSKNNVTIKAVMDSGLYKILNQTGQYEDFISGNIKCSNCGRVVTIDNVSSLLPYQNNESIKVRLYCNNIECVNCEK